MHVNSLDTQCELISIPCPVCGSEDGEVIYRATEHAGSVFGVVPISETLCLECGFLYLNPRPPEQLYQRHYAVQDAGSGAVYREQEATRYIQGSRELATVICNYVKRLTPGRFLDVGCGDAMLLGQMQMPKGWTLEGLEPSPTAATRARTKGLKIHQEFLESFDPGYRYSVISILNVFEHLYQPTAALRRLRELLSDDGVVIVSVPNTLFMRVTLGESFEVEHVSSFTPSSLHRCLMEADFPEAARDPATNNQTLRMVAGKNVSERMGFPKFEALDESADLREAVANYAKAREKLIERFGERVWEPLRERRSQGKRIGLFGAGQHTLQLASLFDLTSLADIVIDSDERKWGRGCAGLEVRPPSALKDHRLDVVLVSSEAFQEEIVSTIRCEGGDDIEILCCY